MDDTFLLTKATGDRADPFSSTFALVGDAFLLENAEQDL